MKDETCGKRRNIEEKVWEDKISALPDDLLVQILLLVPINDAMATAMLSKRWRSLWKMLPRLEYMDPYDGSNVWPFLEKSLLQLSKAPALEKLRISIGPSCPVDVDIGKLIDDVVNRCIQWLHFSVVWSSVALTSLSKSLYTCKTLKKLRLVIDILIDVPSQASLPSLIELWLIKVEYKDEDSLVRLLSSCPVLQNLFVDRKRNDNVTKFSVKIPSLQLLRYRHCNISNIGGSLFIDSPGLKNFDIIDASRDTCLIENMPHCLDMAKVRIHTHPNDKFLTSLSAVMYLNFTWMDAMDAICSAINFPRLIECKLTPWYSDHWVESIMRLLHNAPKLKVLMINSNDIKQSEDLPLGSSVPECLSSHLEIFEWEEYGGARDEKKLMTYILAHSKSLKTVKISLKFKKKKSRFAVILMKELESMHRVSESSQLFFSTQFRWSSMKHHPAYQVMSSF